MKVLTRVIWRNVIDEKEDFEDKILMTFGFPPFSTDFIVERIGKMRVKRTRRQ